MKDKLLYNQIYEKTKDCGRNQFIKLLMQKEIEVKELNRQLKYLRSGEYFNQLRFERNMLQDVVDNMEVAPEDKAFIDCTHRNTELLAQQKEFIEWLEQNIENETHCYLSADKNNRVRYDIFSEILSKYKEIIDEYE